MTKAELSKQRAQVLAAHAEGKPPPGMAERPLSPFPGAAASGRLHGRYATVGIAQAGSASAAPANLFTGSGAAITFANTTTSIVLQCFDYDIEYNQDFAEVTAHGDFWRQRLPVTMDWTGRVRGYFTASAAAAASYMNFAGHLANGGYGVAPNRDPFPLGIIIYSDTAGEINGSPVMGVASHSIFAGTAWVSRSRFAAPFTAMVTQEFELVAATDPFFGPSSAA
jgi:hypothetical protein